MLVSGRSQSRQRLQACTAASLCALGVAQSSSGTVLVCRQVSSAAAEAEKLKAAGDAHKRDLVQAKLVEREAELAAVREKLWAANRETSSEPPADSC